MSPKFSVMGTEISDDGRAVQNGEGFALRSA
jgi:hypothetical protein